MGNSSGIGPVAPPDRREGDSDRCGRAVDRRLYFFNDVTLETTAQKITPPKIK